MRNNFSWLAKGMAYTLTLSVWTFAALADGGAKFLGNITTGGQVRSDMGTYWNQITAENGCKWGSVHSLSGGMSGTSVFKWDNYDKCEGAYKWAKEKPLERHFKFHALVWGSQYPEFLCKKKNPNITVEKTKQYITEWFDAVAAKFPDLEYIDVVNEAIWSGNNYHSGYVLPANGAEGISTDDASCGGSYIIDALGGDQVINGKHQYNFITTAFKMARERWPKAVLIYNDYNTLHWQKNEGIELVQTIIKNGAPVDAYGQQAHDAVDFPDANSFSKVLTEIHDAVNIPLFITEYDIGEANDETQKNIIANHIPFLWETEWIAGITIWGYINGSTWRSNTGIMNADGTDRAAMKWLKQYFSNHLSDGKNTTEFGKTVEPIAQSPFNATSTPWKIPGIIQAEDFDIPGIGTSSNGTSNLSFGDGDSENHGYEKAKNKEDSLKVAYRKNDAPAVDLYANATGIVVGYNNQGDWLEYTVNVEESGDYTLFAAVATDNNTSSFIMYLDDTVITDTIYASKTEIEGSFDDYAKVSANVNLTKGKHILRMEVTGAWFDIDYFNFVKGKDASDPEESIINDNPKMAFNPNSANNSLKFNFHSIQNYTVFDMKGAKIGVISAYEFRGALQQLKSANFIKHSGIYCLHNHDTGEIKPVRISK